MGLKMHRYGIPSVKKQFFELFCYFNLIFCFNVIAAPTAPILTGTIAGTNIDLRFRIDCSITTVNIEYSLDNSKWTQIYTGVGLPSGGGSSASMMRASAFSSSVCNNWTSARYVQLSNQTQPSSYFRIKACISKDCSQYSNSINLKLN